MSISKNHVGQLQQEAEQTASKLAVLKSRLALIKGQAMHASKAVEEWEKVYYSLYAEGEEISQEHKAVTQQVDALVINMLQKKEAIVDLYSKAELQATDDRGNHEGLLETRKVSLRSNVQTEITDKLQGSNKYISANDLEIATAISAYYGVPAAGDGTSAAMCHTACAQFFLRTAQKAHKVWLEAQFDL